MFHLKTNKKATYEDKRIIIPKSLEQQIIFQNHNLPTAGHLATVKTYFNVSQNVWFPDMYKKVDEYCKKCNICDLNRKFFKVNDKLHPIITTRPFEIIEIDHCGPFNRTPRENEYILTIIDHFSRKRWYIPLKTRSAEETFQSLLDEVFTPFEFPKYILSDQGSSFTGKLALDIEKIAGIKPIFAMINQHNTVGSVENANKIMEEIVRKYVNKQEQNDWDKYIRLAAYAINNTISITHKFTPDQLMFGRSHINPFIDQVDEINLPDEQIQNENTIQNQLLDEFAINVRETVQESIKLAADNLEDYRSNMEARYSKKLLPRIPTKFEVGRWIILKTPETKLIKGLSKKLSDIGLGPYKLINYDEETGNAEIEIAPQTYYKVKSNNLRIAKNQNQPELDINTIYPSKMNEIIIINDLNYLESLIDTKNKIRKLNKANYDYKTIVGKRIIINWKSGKYRGWHKGTVIGYTTGLDRSLVFYDEADEDCDRRLDYYAHTLFGEAEEWRLL